MKTFNEKQMSDPWTWALSVLGTHQIKSKDLSDYIGANRSTIRSLMNQTSANPKYLTLIRILEVCIQLENGINLVSSKPEKESSTTLSEADRQFGQPHHGHDSGEEYDWI